MTNTEIKEELDKINTKIERLKPSDERIVTAFKTMKKYRTNAITEGCSEETLEAIDFMIHQIEQIANSLIKLEERKSKVEQELEHRKRVKELQALDRVLQTINLPEFNKACTHFYMYGEEVRCTVGMDIDFCTKNCPYATNVKGSYAVDKRGNIRKQWKYVNGSWQYTY